MAEVWRGKLVGEQGFQRVYAIKKILPHVAEDEEFIAMFTDEALMTSGLQHANIGQVFEFAKVDDTYYIAMEYVSGKDLKSVWSHCRSRRQTLPPEFAAFIVAKMADGLDYAHRKTDNFGNEAGIVHRDVSPQNILLSWDGEVKVIDFGIAKAAEKSGHTRPGTLKGKFAYMSPEQIRGLGLDGRADVFSIGVVLYELCTGERAFSADSEFSLLEMVRNVDIKPPTLVNRNVPEELERIIYKALAKDREHRYQNGAELSEDLQRFLLSRGKTPGRQDLARYLRDNFTVEFEKERSRLESYREITSADAPVPYVGSLIPSDEEQIFASPDAANSNTIKRPSFVDGEAEPSGARPRGGIAQKMIAQTGGNRDGVDVDGLTAGRTITQNVREPSRSALRWLLPSAAALVVLACAAVGGYFVLFAHTSSVVVTVTGAVGGSVQFDERPSVRAEPSVTIDKVTPGSHTLIVQEPGFAAFSTTFVTEAKTRLLQLNTPLKRHAGKLKINSEPDGARVLLDGVDTGLVTPATIEVEGETLHRLQVTLAGYVDELRDDLKVIATGELPVRFVLRPRTVKIRIETTPPVASIAIDGTIVGDSPLTLERKADSVARLKVVAQKRGCDRKEGDVTFDPTVAREQLFSITLRCK